MLYDTTFLIHYSGSRGRADQEKARRFLAARPDSPIYTSRISWTEFAEGCVARGQVDEQLRDFAVIELDEPVAWTASRICRLLDRRGRPIGDNDVWIAATAVTHGLPLVTRNGRHFSRIAGLLVAGY